LWKSYRFTFLFSFIRRKKFLSCNESLWHWFQCKFKAEVRNSTSFRKPTLKAWKGYHKNRFICWVQFGCWVLFFDLCAGGSLSACLLDYDVTLWFRGNWLDRVWAESWSIYCLACFFLFLGLFSGIPFLCFRSWFFIFHARKMWTVCNVCFDWMFWF